MPRVENEKGKRGVENREYMGMGGGMKSGGC